MHLRLANLIAIALAAMAPPAFAVPHIDVTCGDTINAQNGRLTGSCTGSITIVSGRLDLQGFTITGTGLAAIECLGGCRIEGPGAIVSGGSTFGVLGDDRLRVSHVTVSGHASTGVSSGHIGGTRIEDCVIIDNGVGVRGTRLKVRGSTISGNAGTGIIATTRGVNIKNSQVIDNGDDGVATVLSDDFGNVAKVAYSTVSGNGHFGIVAKNISARRSVIRGNADDTECGVSEPCTDVASVKTPRLSAAPCDSSMRIPEDFSGPIPFGPNWGVCLADAPPMSTTTSTVP